MTEPEANGGVEDEEQKEQLDKKQKKHDGGAADLERVTDYAEEKEISAATILNAMQQFGSKLKQEQDELKEAKEKELQKVHVKKEDIELIMYEMEISRQHAEKVLRQKNGDVVAALEALIKE